MLGLFLGRNVAVAIIVGLVSVIVPTIAVLPSRGLRARKMHLALGPFLALGGMVALLAGDDVIAWYTAGTPAAAPPVGGCAQRGACRMLVRDERCCHERPSGCRPPGSA